jgi:putative ABC transport system permease protein
MDWSDRVRRALARDTFVPDADVVEELAQHAQAVHAAARADGASIEEAEAQVAALLALWRVEAPTLHHRRRHAAVVEPPPNGRGALGAGLVDDVRYALRLARREPRRAALVVATLAFGIGAATLLASVAYGVLLKPLPWPNADRVVELAETRGGNPPRFGSMTNAAYLAWDDRRETIARLAAWTRRTMTLSGRGDSERIRVTAASASLFEVLGVRPIAGAAFTRADQRTPVVLLSEGLWRRRFGADPGAIGQSVALDGRAHVVVGVLAAAAAFPDAESQAVVPLEVPAATGHALSMFEAVALLRPGTTPAQAAAEGTARGRFAPDGGMTAHMLFGAEGPIAIGARPLRDAVIAGVERAIVVLLIGAGFLLLTAIANVASLQIAHAATRRRELAIRAALGAGTGRVTRQLLVESLLLGMAGGAAGVGLAWVLLGALPAILPADFPRAAALSLDLPAAGLALLAALSSGVLLGLLPAAAFRRLRPWRALAEGGAAISGPGWRTSSARARLLIMGGQVAIACVLLVGASLLGRSFVAMLTAERGYDSAGVLSARISMPAGLFPTAEQRFAIVDRVMTRLAAWPGLSQAAFTSEIPLTAGGSISELTMRSAAGGGAVVRAQASPRLVSAQYFSTMAMRLTAGRGFSAADDAAAPIAAVVNEAFARRYLGPSPLGTTMPVAGYGPIDGPPLESTVVGVVEDVRYVTGPRASQPEIYYDYRQLRGRLPVQTVTLLVRGAGDASATAAALRTVVRETDDRLVAEAILPLDERLLATLARPRLYASVLAAFASCALTIAAIGLFSVLSYSVSERARELAIRSALGAGRLGVFMLVLRQGLGVIAAGAALGLMAAWWSSGLLATQLYGIVPHDRATFVAVPLALGVVGAVACLAPAIRAARLDPLRILRGE